MKLHLDRPAFGVIIDEISWQNKNNTFLYLLIYKSTYTLNVTVILP
jgi:hypothetical protein